MTTIQTNELSTTLENPDSDIPFDLNAYEGNEQSRLQDYAEFYQRYARNPLAPTPDERMALDSYRARLGISIAEAIRAEELIKERIQARQQLQQEPQCSTLKTTAKSNSLIQLFTRLLFQAS